MARWTESAKWAAGPALDGQRGMPLALRLSEGLGLTRVQREMVFEIHLLGINYFAEPDCVAVWVIDLHFVHSPRL
jgi:hypothetical protein